MSTGQRNNGSKGNHHHPEVEERGSGEVERASEDPRLNRGAPQKNDSLRDPGAVAQIEAEANDLDEIAPATEIAAPSDDEPEVAPANGSVSGDVSGVESAPAAEHEGNGESAAESADEPADEPFDEGSEDEPEDEPEDDLVDEQSEDEPGDQLVDEQSEDEPEDDLVDDEEGGWDEGHDEGPSNESATEGAVAGSPSSNRRPLRPGEATLLTMTFLIVGIYGYNVYLNVSSASQVRDACWVEDQRLGSAISAAADDHLPAPDWMVSLYRARRRYVQEICDEAVLRLAWWRWNLTGGIEVDLSEHTRQDIDRILTRAASSCDFEVQQFEKVMNWELQRRHADGELRSKVREVLDGQRSSCDELKRAVSEARTGFWPPLVASGPADVPLKLRSMMPRSLHAFGRASDADEGEDGQP